MTTPTFGQFIIDQYPIVTVMGVAVWPVGWVGSQVEILYRDNNNVIRQLLVYPETLEKIIAPRFIEAYKEQHG